VIVVVACLSWWVHVCTALAAAATAATLLLYCLAVSSSSRLYHMAHANIALQHVDAHDYLMTARHQWCCLPANL
jgi:hypothetical protein